jgi:hypothetical protein
MDVCRSKDDPPAGKTSNTIAQFAAARRRNLALLQEGIRDRNRLIEQSARIVAQVDDEGLELVAGLDREIGDRLLQVPSGLLVELGDADKADVVAFEA